MLSNLFIRGVNINWDKISRESYLRDIPAINKLKSIELNTPVTFFVGENGSGKSTLLEAIAVSYGFNPEGGTKNYAFSTYDSHSELSDAISLVKGIRKNKSGYFLRAESFYNVATAEMGYEGVLSNQYHARSHGESFLSVMQSYLDSNGVYIYDEPEAALSPQRQLTLMMEIYRSAQAGAQFIIATHSPILLGMPEATIYSFDDGEICTCAYEDTESYQVTKMFINDKDVLLKRLLEE